MTQVLHVDLVQHSYPIHIGTGLLSRFEELLPESLRGRPAFLIYDQAVESWAQDLMPGQPRYAVPSGEASKSLNELETVLDWLLSEGADRHSYIIAIGGGVTGDLAGFAAATLMRGVPVVQVPTTLLAMVDSSVGGKTGINTPRGKNLIGAFHQPAAVLCDFDVLKTLPKRELKAGYAEILKYALLGDAVFFEWLEEHGKDVLSLQPDALSFAINRSCEMKAEIVQADEREKSGLRALLNLGHTFAHAFEAVMGYDGRLIHGEAVAVGLVCAMELSNAKNLMPSQQSERVVQHMSSIGMKTSIADLALPENLSPDTLIDLMRHDKKAKDGQLTFILLTELGKSFVSEDVSEEDVVTVLKSEMTSTLPSARTV